MQKLRIHYLREGNPNATEVYEYDINIAHHFCFNQSQLTSYWNIIHFMAHLDNNMSTRRAVLVSIFSQAYSISDLPWISGHCAGSNWVWQVLSNLLENTKLLINLHYIWTTLGQSHFWIFRSDKYIDWRAYDLELYKSTLLQFLNHLGIVGDRNTNVTLVGHNWGFLLGGTLIKGNKLIYIVSRILFWHPNFNGMNKEFLNLD